MSKNKLVKLIGLNTANPPAKSLNWLQLVFIWPNPGFDKNLKVGL